MRIGHVIVSLAILSATATTALAEVPQIFAGTNREIEVTFKNNCVVYFNAQGRLTKRLPACTAAQAAQAIDAASRHRREQGFDRPVASHNDPTGKIRVCCQRKSNDWFTTRDLCRGVSGIEVPDAVCRKDANNLPWSSARSDYERVCCGRGLHDWATTRGDCRHSSGLEVPKALCRDDRDNSSWWHGQRGDDYDNYRDRPPSGYFAGPAEVSYTCYGEGDRPVLDNWDDKRWISERSTFPAAVMIEINTEGSRYSGRIHPSGRLIPPLHVGDQKGWWQLKDIVVTPNEVQAQYKLNGLNKPRLSIDRRSGRIFIEGIERFTGRCWSGP